MSRGAIIPDSQPCYVSRRPLVGLAFAAALAMACAARGMLSFGVCLSAAVVLLLAGFFGYRSRRGLGLVYAVWFFVSAARYLLGVAAVSEADVRTVLPHYAAEPVQLEGVVDGVGAYYPGSRPGRGLRVVPFRCSGLSVSNQWQRLRGRVQLRLQDVPDSAGFQVGQSIQCRGTITRRIFPGGRPFEVWVDGERNVVSGARGFSFRAEGERLRQAASRRLAVGLERYPDQLAVYRALLLGYRRAIPSDINTLFSRTGTLHVFAISGLHVGMVGLLLVVGLKFCGVPRGKWGLILIPLLWVYVVSTGARASALRAFTMTAVFFAAPLFRRKPDVPTAVALAAIVLLFVDPAQIAAPGFVYSFVVVSFLVLFFSVLSWGQWFSVGGRWVGAASYAWALGVTTVAAFMASAPLTAFYFGMFSPISLLGNLAVVPLTFGIVLCGWLSILFPPGSEIFNFGALFFIDLLLAAVRGCEALPAAWCRVPPPPQIAIGLWYLGWIGLLTHARLRHRRAEWTTLILVALLMMLTASLVG